jgi:hypothetical protein
MPEADAQLHQGFGHSFAEVYGVRLHYASDGSGRFILFL